MSDTAGHERAHRKLALGTAQFGLKYGIANNSGQVQQQDVQQILGVARSAGLNTLDTAIDYGSSESALGSAGVDDWQVISKLPAVPDDISDPAAWMQQQVEESLERLGIAHLSALLLHRPAQLLDDKGAATYRGLEHLRASGLVDRIGVSVYAPDELDALWAKFDAFDVVQAPLTILDRRLLSSGWLERLHDQGVEVHTRSAFLQGLLLLNAAQRPHQFSRWDELWQQWDNWLLENQTQALQACIAFPLSLSTISRVIVGVESLEQLQQILTAAVEQTANLPALQCDDPELLNPALWATA